MTWDDFFKTITALGVEKPVMNAFFTKIAEMNKQAGTGVNLDSLKMNMKNSRNRAGALNNYNRAYGGYGRTVPPRINLPRRDAGRPMTAPAQGLTPSQMPPRSGVLPGEMDWKNPGIPGQFRDKPKPPNIPDPANGRGTYYPKPEVPGPSGVPTVPRIKRRK